MVARITFPKRMETALNYNEAKVQQGKAVCLQACNYLREAHEMNFYQKLEGFRRLNELNERATTKTIRISLNFAPSEKLSDSKLMELANAYMGKIGFGEQPFLVYKHEDAGHPHIHIVSNTIQDDGSRINTHNMGRNQSENARKELEQLYGLVRAEEQKQKSNLASSVKIEKAVYGKHETKRAIVNVVATVFNQYRFTSLPEYNAALRQFNVMADRGKEDGRIYKNGGLIYRILDAEGNKTGVPIKASSIHCRPTLKNLEAKFLSNQSDREPYKQRVKEAIERGLLH
ncbi:MAG: relaxase/mobilization nuclease domain-containing protein, partial [Bacteroidota bacterium]|nr:relaxase/mobilization nuclease domain-containing protein [Bacteroidota bacterium]